MDHSFASRDIPTYLGRLIGLRSFAVTPSSELTGITYAGRWVDGENWAKCALRDPSFNDDNPDLRDQGNLHAARYGLLEALDEAHTVGKIDCTCGYYAYFRDNDNPYQGGIHVEGVIEGWGKLTIGANGFRASKARIVGLVIPHETYPVTWQDKLLHRVTCSASWRTGHAWSWPYIAARDGCDLPLFQYPAQMYEIMARYPNAKTFNSKDEMLEAFPPTPVDVAEEILED